MHTSRRLLVSATLVALAVAASLFFPEQEDGSGSVFGGIGAFFATLVGLSAAARVRPMPQRTSAERVRLAALALAAGVGVGVANLLVNYGMSLLDPAIREQMVTRWAEFSTWSVVFAEPMMEELAYRLVLLSGIAWLAARFTSNHRTIEFVALAVSALLFGVAHVFYGGVEAPLYAVGMAVKSSAGGVAFGLVFWRWGLPYSILCHCIANGTHLLLMPLYF